MCSLLVRKEELSSFSDDLFNEDKIRLKQILSFAIEKINSDVAISDSREFLANLQREDNVAPQPRVVCLAMQPNLRKRHEKLIQQMLGALGNGLNVPSALRRPIQSWVDVWVKAQPQYKIRHLVLPKLELPQSLISTDNQKGIRGLLLTPPPFWKDKFASFHINNYEELVAAVIKSNDQEPANALSKLQVPLKEPEWQQLSRPDFVRQLVNFFVLRSAYAQAPIAKCETNQRAKNVAQDNVQYTSLVGYKAAQHTPQALFQISNLSAAVDSNFRMTLPVHRKRSEQDYLQQLSYLTLRWVLEKHGQSIADYEQVLAKTRQKLIVVAEEKFAIEKESLLEDSIIVNNVLYTMLALGGFESAFVSALLLRDVEAVREEIERSEFNIHKRLSEYRLDMDSFAHHDVHYVNPEQERYIEQVHSQGRVTLRDLMTPQKEQNLDDLAKIFRITALREDIDYDFSKLWRPSLELKSYSDLKLYAFDGFNHCLDGSSVFLPLPQPWLHMSEEYEGLLLKLKIIRYKIRVYELFLFYITGMLQTRIKDPYASYWVDQCNFAYNLLRLVKHTELYSGIFDRPEDRPLPFYRALLRTLWRCVLEPQHQDLSEQFLYEKLELPVDFPYDWPLFVSSVVAKQSEVNLACEQDSIVVSAEESAAALAFANEALEADANDNIAAYEGDVLIAGTYDPAQDEPQQSQLGSEDDIVEGNVVYLWGREHLVEITDVPFIREEDEIANKEPAAACVTEVVESSQIQTQLSQQSLTNVVTNNSATNIVNGVATESLSASKEITNVKSIADNGGNITPVYNDEPDETVKAKNPNASLSQAASLEPNAILANSMGLLGGLEMLDPELVQCMESAVNGSRSALSSKGKGKGKRNKTR